MSKKKKVEEYKRKEIVAEKDGSQSSIIDKFFDALYSGDMETVTKMAALDRSLVNSKNFFGTPAIHYAVQSKKPEVVEGLIKLGAEVDATDGLGKTGLLCAAGLNRLDLIKLLVTHKANIKAADKYGNTILHNAAMGVVRVTENWEAIKWLVKNGADPQAKNNSGIPVVNVFNIVDGSYAQIYEEIVGLGGESNDSSLD